MDSTAVTPQYRRGGNAILSNVPESCDSHELETLMPPGSQESGQQLTEVPEEQRLMANAVPGEEDSDPAPESKVRTYRGGGPFPHCS